MPNSLESFAMASMSLPCQGQNSMAGKPNAAACLTRSRNGSLVYHISQLTANFVCGVLPSDDVSSAAEARCVLKDKAATPPTADVARKDRRSSEDMARALELGAVRGDRRSRHYSFL